MIYLAYPIDQAGPHNGTVGSLVTAARAILHERGVAAYDPGQPFTRPGLAPEEVVRINNAAVDECSGVLALLPHGVPSVGVPMEITRAAFRSAPVAVVGSDSMMLTSYDSIRVFGDAYDDMVKAVNWLASKGLTKSLLETLHWTGDHECAPTRAYRGDAGYDLRVARDTRIHIDAFVDVDLGIKVQLPSNMWAMVTGRSSTLRKRGILVAQGIIDSGYRGPMFAGCRNLSNEVVELNRGERVAQLIPMPLIAPRLELKYADGLEPSDRGENGFGSSGV